MVKSKKEEDILKSDLKGKQEDAVSGETERSMKTEEPQRETNVQNEDKKDTLSPTINDRKDDGLPDQYSNTTLPASLEKFDWDAFSKKGFGDGYSPSEREKIENIYAGSITSLTEGEVVKGTVVGINKRDIVLNIGFKSDGLVSSAEFKDMPDLKIGDEVDLFVEEREDAVGQLVLSRKKAKLVKSWENMQKSFEEDFVVEGFVKRRTKGGLIVEIYGIEAFLPGSQIDVKPIRDFDIYVNKTIEVKVVKINHANDNVVVSHKILIEKDIEKQKVAILNNLEKGQVLEGVIKNMTDFGVFIDLGGVDGLLHITDISWERVNHPSKILKLDQVVKVVVLDFDENKKRISLGMKQLTPHPWDTLPEDIDVGSKVKGKIVNVSDYGGFLEIQPGVEGLIHVSEMSWSQHLNNTQDFVKIGDEVEAVVLTIDRSEHKMSLGMKQLTENPWTRQDMPTKYAVNTKHTGIVRNLTNFGLFIELEEGVDGLLHISDLSWTKRIKHPSDFIQVGESLEVILLELDIPNRRLALSHKHLEENPWNTFESVFEVGSLHKCMVISKTDKGGVLELPYGMESFCALKNLIKQDGTQPAIGETLEFKVLDISKEEKRITMSHKAVWSGEEIKKPSFKKHEYDSQEKTIAQINRSTEKSMLSDIESLSTLKKKMTAENSKTEKDTE